jgi:hypothetical protein
MHFTCSPVLLFDFVVGTRRSERKASRRALKEMATEPGREDRGSVLGTLRAMPIEAHEDHARDDGDDTEDDPPRHIGASRREKAAAPDDTADSRSIHVSLSVSATTASAHAKPFRQALNRKESR